MTYVPGLAMFVFLSWPIVNDMSDLMRWCLTMVAAFKVYKKTSVEKSDC